MSTLPRPSRPSLGPPTAPLPSIPQGLKRQSSNNSLNNTAATTSAVTSPTAPTGRLPHPGRTPSSSSIPSSAGIAASTTPTTANGTTPSSAAQERALRKKPSYNVFPKPAGSAPPTRPSSQHSTTSVRSTTPRTSTRGSTLVNGNAAGLKESAFPKSPPAEPPSAPIGREIRHKQSESAMTIATTVSAYEDGEDTPRGRRMTGTKDKGNVIVSVRIRPEKDGSASPEWNVDGPAATISYAGKEGGEYSYDNLFTSNDKNHRVYDAAAKRLVRRVMEGYHGTVFAYGMTGTGKTYSMQGTATSPGVIPLAITDIFSFIRETPQREFLLRVSYLEIYNEKIHDLLSTPTSAGPGQPQVQEEIKIREDSRRGVYVTPLKEEIVQSPTQLLRVIARGDQVRRTAGTQFNARSSRSHAVVQIVVESRERNAGGAAVTPTNKRGGMLPGGVRVSTLSLIDLAGSERAAENKDRRTEGAHINKSLLTLGTVISKLSGKRDKSGQPMDTDGKHLPYRDSKLTRLLQPALSGNSLISILCTVQTAAANPNSAVSNPLSETLNTLKFASRAKNNIVSNAKKSEESHAGIGDAGSRALLDRYRAEILELRKQLENQKGAKTEKPPAKEKTTSAPATPPPEEEVKKDPDSEARHEEQLLEMQLARTALKERIEHLNRLILSSKSIGVNTGRTYSTLSLANRGSQYAESVRSLRTSTSTHTFNEDRRRTSTASHATTHIDDSGPGYGEEDIADDTGDGTASLQAQIKSLQEDLADKNRYISTLEKRLLQARRSSRSRLSMTISNRNSLRLTEDGSIDTLIREKDDEIAELRARLEDKDRMLDALRSAARKRDNADNSRPSSRPSSVATLDRVPTASEAGDAADGTLPSNGRRRPSVDTASLLNSAAQRRRGSVGSTISQRTNPSYSSASPMGRLMQKHSSNPVASTQSAKRNHGVDEMTRMLDEMIRQKVEASANKSGRLSEGANATATSRSLSRQSIGRSPVEIDSRRTSGWDNDVRKRRQSLRNSAATAPIESTNSLGMPTPTHSRTNSTRSGATASMPASPALISEFPKPVTKDEPFAAQTRGLGHDTTAASTATGTTSLAAATSADATNGHRSRASSTASGESRASTVVMGKTANSDGDVTAEPSKTDPSNNSAQSAKDGFVTASAPSAILEAVNAAKQAAANTAKAVLGTGETASAST